MSVRWAATPDPGTPDWPPKQATAGVGKCASCGREKPLRPDPYVLQPSCRGCWEALVYGDDG